MLHLAPPEEERNDRRTGGDEFEQYRRLLMGTAYRMLASSTEAEDAMQDAWLRWQSANPAAIVDARAWLSTTIVRLCLDRLKSARARRETYPGVWSTTPRHRKTNSSHSSSIWRIRRRRCGAR